MPDGFFLRYNEKCKNCCGNSRIEFIDRNVRWRSKAGVGFRTKGATYFSLIPLCKAQSQFQRRSIATDGPGARRCNLNQHGRREEWLHRLAAVFPESNSEAYFQHRQQQQRWCPIFACFLNNLFIYSRLKLVAGFPLSAQSDASGCNLAPCN